MTASVCLFIGVPVSMRSVRALAGAAAELQERAPADMSLRWQAPARYHLTLKFLGWCQPEVVSALRDVVGAALRGQAPFEMRCRELGAFPSLEAARVLWAGIDDRGGQLSGLAQTLDAAASELGFPAETRQFHPHVTLARLKRKRDLVSLVQESPVRVFSKTSVDRLILYKSSVESKTSEYEQLASWPLETTS